ncbi:MAG: zinc ABC transporter substrate-binding protein [Rhodospirillaceae bacterium]|nr:zinc ABC transporter substrate-binding protein [Rhodospirillaceae bacterium]
MICARMLAIVAAGVMASASASAAPKVVVSIKPIASLVEGVMAGVGTPGVIVGSGQSLHTFSMRPSDAKALNDAEVVFWVGEGLETFLAKPLLALSGRATIIELSQTPGLTLLPGREGGVWEEHDEDHDAPGVDHDHQLDGHVWLDPANAKAIVRAVQVALSQADSTNAPAYAANAKAVIARIEALDAELRATLDPVKHQPFVVFHDGYQYFEKHYGLNAAGSITVNPDRMPGAKRVGEIKDKIKSLKAACVFAEPQFEPKLVQTLVEGSDANTGTLDPEASTLRAGADLYFELMRGLAANLKACFTGS